MSLIDSHAHLDFIEDLDGVISRAKDESIEAIVTIGTSVECSMKCIQIADTHSHIALADRSEGQVNIPAIYATCGIHPEDGKKDLDKFGNDYISELEKVVKSSDKVVAIGECGLDYHIGRDQRPVTSSEEKGFQRELFKNQVELALKLDLPLVVHCRNAWEEIFEIISEAKQGLSLTGVQGETLLRGVFHSWTGDCDAAKKALELGFYISFSGIITFKNAKDIQESAKIVPLNRMLIETDSPFLAPEPFRGSKNEPKNVRIIADFLASFLDVPAETIYSATNANCQELFGIQLKKVF